MNSQASGPGKTAPKLAHDFFRFDPLRATPNVLLDVPPPQGDGVQLGPPLLSCNHEYTVKTVQSVPPPIDLRPDGNAAHRLNVICKRCRLHADIMVDTSCGRRTCPTNEHALHHFQRVPGENVTATDRIRYVWKCSVDECSTILFMVFRLPRIKESILKKIANPDELKRRYQAVIADNPERDGILECTPMQALSRLGRYVKDGYDDDRTRDQFPSNNKRFMEAFGVHGEDAREVLDQLGFESAEDSWALPKPDQVPDRLAAVGDTQRELLEDVHMEVLAAMYKLAADTGVENISEKTYSMPPANLDIARILAATGYQRQAPGRRAGTNTELPFYLSLGILPDFSDSLVEYAFDRQIHCDPAQRAYYFECLQVITDQRQTENLQVKVATLQSQDVISRRDLTAAYRYFNITPPQAKVITDEQIRDKFQARQSDLGVVAQEEARQHLYKIAIARGSSLLLSTSRQSVETEEDALSWLGHGANKSTADGGLLAIFAIRKEESKAHEDIALKAIATIAKARKSSTLNNFLLTGEQDTPTMSVDEALRHLNIEQKLDELDPTLVPVLFDSARQDRPGDLTERAITAIQQALAGSSNEPHPPETWPVGLTSLGNTCYLNSLLQYYFSVKPLREIVLNYDQFKWDTTRAEEKKIRVGHAMVSTVEIEGGQRFAEELRRLFIRMIKSRDYAVKPEADLVCRAFLRPKDYKLMDPVMEDEKKTDGDETMVNGVDSAVDDKLLEDDSVMSPTTTLTDGGKESDASSTTLVNGDSSDIAMRDGDTPLTPPASPGIVGVDQPKPEHAPPPLPPRRFSTTKEAALEKARENARSQQDVTEVHDSITTLLRYGMSPRAEDIEGEQEDVLRDLFSIQTAQVAVREGVEGKPKAQSDSAIQLNVPFEAIDLYSALDAVFDLQPLAEDPAVEAYRTIRSLGPLLQISIPRIGYDKTRGGSFKATSCVRLHDELYLDRYFETSDPEIMQKKRQGWSWRKRLQMLERELKVLKNTTVDDLDGPSAVEQTAEYLISLDEVNRDLESIDVEPIEADGEITGALTTEAQQQKDNVASLDAEISALQTQLDGQFQDMKNIKYRLAAVFFHRGNYTHGHYWIYIHDFANDIWRLYNDERVEKFDKLDIIFEAKDWNDGTPTYAVYVAEDKIQDYVNPVCRDPEPEPESAPQPSKQDSWAAEGFDGKSTQPTPTIAIDPALANEGGQASWDESREVAQGVRW